MTNLMTCPVCMQTALQDFLTIDRVPVHVGIVWPSRQEALAAPTGTICLAFCTHCGFVTNRTFDPALMDYVPGYEVSLHHSLVYQAFVAATIEKLVTQYGVRNKVVLEVGCGRGYFLKELCRRGHNQGIGVDPSLDLDATMQERVDDVRFARAIYDEKFADVAVDCVVCRHVLQHIPDPKAFILSVCQANASRPDTLIYFELPNSAYVFESVAAWNIFYEHCSYISLDLLRRAFVACGSTVMEHGPCYEDGQYMNLFAAVGQVGEYAITPHVPGQGLSIETVQRFAGEHSVRVQSKRERLQHYAQQGKRVVAWGSGGRGVSFLNSMDAAGGIEYVVDINPERQQKYLPGSAQRVIAPEELAHIRPDVIVLTNPTYRDEICRMVQGMGLAPEYMTA